MEQQATSEQLLTMIEEAVSAEKQNNERIVSFFQECFQLGIDILPLDINRSEASCVFETETSLRLGFSVILSGNAPFLESFLTDRREKGHFQNFQDCCERLDLAAVPNVFFPRCIESGAFDTIEESRARLFKGYEKIVKAVQSSKAEEASNQISLFAALPAAAAISVPPLPQVDEWTDEERIDHEKHAMGFSFTAYLSQQEESEETESESEAAPHVAEETSSDYHEQEEVRDTSEKNDKKESAEDETDESVSPSDREKVGESQEPQKVGDSLPAAANDDGSEVSPAESPEDAESNIPNAQKNGVPGMETKDSGIVAPPFDDDIPPFPPETFTAEELDASFPQGFDEPPHPAREDAETDSEAERGPTPEETSAEHAVSQFQHVILQCRLKTTTEQTLLRIQELCRQHTGELMLFLEFIGENQQKTYMPMASR
ncbi:hypothetical protein CSA56_18685 [candidate division KSB3 bacterium]|uniref:DNA polymerase helix-hairpin-helix motif domain-containing protein n=1 Tax=candidate division KSB3 bacterium TaxID=2044937 RepID=A0A2G6K8J7_9BACT|nr:MAG: hypothetical protein CSA56_18685 [candidate division KSB3 bacterium]